MDRTRASDAERELTAERLREACLDGRLDHDELDERLTAALGARTRGELARVVADLPGAAAPPVAPTTWARVSRRRLALAATLLTLLVVAGAASALELQGLIVLGFVAVAVIFTLVMFLVVAAPAIALGGGAVWLARRLAREAVEERGAFPPLGPEAPPRRRAS